MRGKKRKNPDTPTKHLVLSSDLDSLLPQDYDLKALADAIADPMDFRSAKQLSVDLHIPEARIKQLQNDPEFMTPVGMKFNRALTHTRVLVLKDILSRVQEGNMGAAKLALQALGMVSTPGERGITLNLPGGGVQDSFTKLTDEELDREITRLLMETCPDELIVSGGNIIPANYEEVGNAPWGDQPKTRRDELPAEEGEVSSTPSGEEEKTS